MTEGLWVQDDIPRLAPLIYGRGEMEISDHKPILAVLELQVARTEREQKELLDRFLVCGVLFMSASPFFLGYSLLTYSVVVHVYLISGFLHGD